MLALMLFALVAAAPEPDLDQLRRNFEAGQESNREFRRRAFVEHGFRPLAELTAEGREVRRLTVSVWLPGRPPGIEIERRRDGSVTLSLIRPEAAPVTFDLPRETWAAIESHDDAFRRPQFDLADYQRRRQMTPTSCHATRFHFESTGVAGERSAGAFGCPNGLDLFTPAKIALIETMVRAALATQEQCQANEPSRSIDYVFHNCFVRPGA